LRFCPRALPCGVVASLGQFENFMFALKQKSALNPEGALLRLHFLIKFSNAALAKIASGLSEI